MESLNFIICLFVFFLTNFFIFTVAVTLTHHFSSKENRVHSILSVISLYLGQIIFYLVLLGTIQQLNIYALVVLITALSVIIIFSLKVNLRELSAFARNIFYIKPIYFYSLFFFLIFIFVVLSTFKLRLPYHGDSLSYHLPIVINWLKTQNIWEIFYYSASDLGVQSYFPANNEIFSLWFILPFKSDTALNLYGALVVIWGVISIYGLSRLINPESKQALPLSLIYLLFPLYYIGGTNLWLNINSSDILAGSAFIASLYWLFYFSKKHSQIAVLFFALTFGIFIGSKVSSPFYGAPLVVLFFYFLLIAGVRPYWQKIQSLGVFLIGIITMGGFWFLRNLILTGNPLFNYKLTLLGKTIFDGLNVKLGESLLKLMDINLIFKTIKIHLFKGEGIIFFFTVSISIIFLIMFIQKCFHKRDHVTQVIKDNCILCVLFWILLFSYFNIPIGEYLALNERAGYRYGLPYMACSLAFLGSLELPRCRWKKHLFWGAIVISFIWNVFMIVKTFSIVVLVLSVIITALMYVFFSPSHQILKREIREGRIILALIVIVALIFPIRMYSKQSERHENIPFQNIYQWINKNIKNARIAYAGLAPIYPLYGEHYQNEVKYVNTNAYNDYDHKDYFDLFTSEKLLNNSVVYAFSYIDSDSNKEALLQYEGTRAFIKLNNDEMKTEKELQSNNYSLKKVVKIKKGVNQILLKLIIENQYNFSLKIAAPDGTLLPNLKYCLQNQDNLITAKNQMTARPIDELLIVGTYKSNYDDIKTIIERDYLTDGNVKEEEITPSHDEVFNGNSWQLARTYFPYYNLNLLIDGKLGNAALYGHLYVYSDKKRNAILSIGTTKDGGYRVFLNKALIGYNYNDDGNYDKYNTNNGYAPFFFYKKNITESWK